MISALRAEYQKILGHRWLMGFTMWIFPIGLVAMYFVQTILLRFVEQAQNFYTPLKWTDQVLGTWQTMNSPLTQILLLTLASTYFAGEAQWGTWKNIVTRRSRIQILLVKYLAILTIVIAIFAITSVIAGIGTSIISIIFEGEVVPVLIGDDVGEFIGRYLGLMLLGGMNLLLLMSIVAIVGILMRSVIAGALTGFVVAILIEAMITPFLLFSNIFNDPSIAELYRFTPVYNRNNLDAWIMTGGKEFNFSIPFELTEPDSALFSLIMLSIWIILGIAVSIFLFRRRDIVS